MTEDIRQVIEDITRHLSSAKIRFGRRHPVEWITCGDGTVLSVQAGEFLYCQPRNNQGPWSHVEIMPVTSGFQPRYIADEPVEEGDVYGYVPIEKLAQEIISRGNLQLTR